MAGRRPQQQGHSLSLQLDELPQVIAHRPAGAQTMLVRQHPIKPPNFLTRGDVNNDGAASTF
jgi:hypothetical protein